MTNKDLDTYLKTYVSKHGDEVRVEDLALSFEGFKPYYKPRKGAKDEAAARKAAITRAVTNLYNALLEALVNDRLTHRDPEGEADFSKVSVSHGGSDLGTKRLPNYLVKLDQRFIAFTQSLGSSIGGRKTSATDVTTKRSEEANELVAALERLTKSTSKEAKAFITVYKKHQAKLRLPKLP